METITEDESNAPAEKSSRLRGTLSRLTGSLLELLKKIVPSWLQEPLNRLPAKIHNHPLIVCIIAIPFVIFVLIYYHDDLFKFAKQVYQPDILIRVIPADKNELPLFSEANLLYETKLRHNSTLLDLNNDSDVRQLFGSSSPIKLRRFSCNGKPSEVYELVVAIQNQGDNTAKDNKLAIWFASNDISHPDPEVRIAYIAGDGLVSDYEYQQDGDISLPRCIEADKKKKFDLVKSVYRNIGLTRDVAILRGTLEAHLFQIAVLLIKVPPTVSQFAVVLDIDCPDCRWGYKTNTYGQLVSTAK